MTAPALDPGVAALLRRLDEEGRGLGRLPLDEERASYRAFCLEQSAPPPAGVATDDLTISGEVEIPARLYVPPSADAPAGCLVFVHGGGGVIGDVAAYDSVCRTLAHASGVRVLSVDYRLAPEHPAAAAFDDAEAAVRWAFAHAEALGVDPQRIAVGGDSQGGLLAAAAAQRCRDLPLALQLLIYPGLGLDPEISAPFMQGYYLDADAIAYFTGHLHAAGGPEILALMPHGKDLRGCAPAHIVTAGFDLLSSGVPQYTALLSRADVPYRHEDFPTLTHSFLTMSSASEAAADAVRRVATALRDGLAH